ncbi:hypothetical protein [Nocardia sp. NPDC052566]|uniref:hypothetical protein n=1 Tax=Nocardia sp. NPDC052566 TaxID=3364330 RepID=UPI0037C9F006
MVCRENKCRSTAIRLAKELNRAQGWAPLHDRELQSALHERTHEFDAAPDMTTEQQIAFVKGLRQQIENDQDLSEQEKYRISHRQPGLITRLDEEIERLRTGQITDQYGRTRPLQDMNRNSGAQLQAMQYLGTMVGRIQRAKEDYFELNARHTGRSVSEVRAQWNTIMDREGEGRGNVGISLRDDWRDQLAVAGLSAQAQADIGQSKRARDALAEMESQRQAVLAKQPHRPTIRPEHRRRYVPPGQGQIRCDKCGQFGHDGSACPNSDLVGQRTQLAEKHRVATNQLKAANIERYLASGEVTDEAERRALEAERDSFTAGQPVGTVAAADAELRRIAQQDSQIQAQLDERAPKVSTWVQEVAYNEESGLMTVTLQPRRRKDGTQVPAMTYEYRVTKDEANRILEHPDVGVAVNQSVMQHGKGRTNDAYHWENRADAEAARTQHQCPTCGRWASMTSSHTCPVKGARATATETDDRAELTLWRRNARAAQSAGQEPPPKPMPRVPVTGGKHWQLPGGGVAYIPKPDAIRAVTDDGKVAAAAVTMKRPDATVSGQVSVWQDPDGARLVSPLLQAGGTGLRCTCETYKDQGRCPHIRAATLAVARNWAAHPILDPDVRPGVSVAEVHRDRTSDTAFDAPKQQPERLNYSRIRKFRTDRVGNHLAGLCEKQRRGEPINGPTVRPPRDAEGNTITWPDTFQRPGGNRTHAGKPVDLNDAAAVQYRLRAAFFARTRKHCSVRIDPDGGMVVTVPKARRAPDGSIPLAERRELCATFGIPAERSRADGLHIPNDTSWRHEMLSRAYGDELTVHASRFSVA